MDYMLIPVNVCPLCSSGGRVVGVLSCEIVDEFLGRNVVGTTTHVTIDCHRSMSTTCQMERVKRFNRNHVYRSEQGHSENDIMLAE